MWFVSTADVGMQLSDQAVVLESLHNRAVNPKVMQNAVSQHRQGGREFDDQDFLRKVRFLLSLSGVSRGARIVRVRGVWNTT